MARKRRVTALILAAVILAALLISSAFIIADAGHDCACTYCMRCYRLVVCKSILSSMTCAMSVAVLWLCTAIARRICLPAVGTASASGSLITLKVKLSD